MTVDISLNLSRQEEIFSKNRSITSIMEYSVLGSPYFNFQMKVQMLKAIIQERFPELYTKYGKQIFSLISKIQDMRNLIAHFKTYVYKEDILISKPKAKFIEIKGQTQKGGINPEPIGKYEAIYDQEKLTSPVIDKISEQITIVGVIINHFSLIQDSIFPTKNLRTMLEELLGNKDLYIGGVYEIDLIK